MCQGSRLQAAQQRPTVSIPVRSVAVCGRRGLVAAQFARELEDQQRIAERLGVDVLDEGVVDVAARNDLADELAALIRGKAMQLKLRAQSVAHHRRERPAQLGRRNQLFLVCGRDQQPGPPRPKVGEVPDEVEAEWVDIAKIAEDDEHGFATAQVGEQPDDLGQQTEVLIAWIRGQRRQLRTQPERREEPRKRGVAARKLLALLL